jgi:3',5'-nucleoside bisphosphate phosphatase
MKIDLHSHSFFSDGQLSPEALIERAVIQEVTHLALTDHDTLLGLPRAKAAAVDLPITLIDGVEVSCTWRNQTLHILGLNVDVNNQEMLTCFEGVKQKRLDRAEKIAAKLTKIGITGLRENVIDRAKGIVGRLHFANYLVEKGLAKAPGKAFNAYMKRGKPGYVRCEWMSMPDAVALILQAGGIPVVAHPRRYSFTFKRLTELMTEFKECGGIGVEVATSSQGKDDQQLLMSLSRTLDLYTSVGSDFHAPCAYNNLGKARFLVDPVYKPISELLLPSSGSN